MINHKYNNSNNSSIQKKKVLNVLSEIEETAKKKISSINWPLKRRNYWRYHLEV